MDELLGVAVRVAITYFYLLACVRATGKRTIGQLSIPDAAAAFIVGDMFDNVVWAKVDVAQGLAAIGVVLLLHLLVVYGAYRWRSFSALVESTPTLVVRAGQPVPDGMRAERVIDEALHSMLREKGVDRVEEIQESFKENSDHLSAVKKPEYRPAQKRDMPKLEAALR